MADLPQAGPANSFMRLALIAAGLALVLLAMYGLTSSPSEHDVYTDGGTPLAYTVGSVYPGVHVMGPIAPTLSLADVRCDAWLQQHTGSCPNEPTLAATYWPSLRQEQQTLYVGVLNSCDKNQAHFNLEYIGFYLILHCHETAPWLHLNRGPMGANMEILAELVIVSTSHMEKGSLYVWQDDRVERWVSDLSQRTLLGVVAIG